VEERARNPAVVFLLALRPARVEDFGAGGGAAARGLRAAVAAAARVPPLVVLFAAAADGSGNSARFQGGDPINVPEGEGAEGEGGLYDLLDAWGGGGGGGGAQQQPQRRLARRHRALEIELVPGAPAAAAPPGGVAVTVNVILGTAAQAAEVTLAIQGAGEGALAGAALEALAAEKGLPFPGNFSGGLVAGTIQVATVARRRTRWQRLAAFLAAIALPNWAIGVIAAAAAAACGALSVAAWRRRGGRRAARVAAAPHAEREGEAAEELGAKAASGSSEGEEGEVLPPAAPPVRAPRRGGRSPPRGARTASDPAAQLPITEGSRDDGTAHLLQRRAERRAKAPLFRAAAAVLGGGEGGGPGGGQGQEVARRAKSLLARAQLHGAGRRGLELGAEPRAPLAPSGAPAAHVLKPLRRAQSLATAGEGRGARGGAPLAPPARSHWIDEL